MKFGRIQILILAMILSSCVGSLFTKRNVRMGKEALSSNNQAEAFIYFNKAIRNNRHHGEAYYYRGSIYEHRKMNDLALLDYIQAYENSTNKDLSGLAAGRLLLAKGDFDASLPFLQSAYYFDTTNVEIGYYLMRSLIGNSKAEEALLLLEKYPETKNNAKMNFAKALASDSLGIFDYASVFYRNAIELDKSLPGLFEAYSNLLLKKGNTEAALDIATKGIQFQNSIECYKIRLSIYMSNYQWNRSISEATTLYNITKDLEYIERRARFYQFIGLLNNAKKDYSFILSQEPQNSNALFHRAIVNQRLQEEDLVLSDLSEFLKIDEKLVPEWQTNRAKELILLIGREIPPPSITIIKPKMLNKKHLGYSQKTDSITIEGTLVENAKLIKLEINHNKITTKPFGDRLKTFTTKIPFPTNDTVKIIAVDIYENYIEQRYELTPIENNTPELLILNPKIDSIGNASIQSSGRFFNFKFLAADESYISSYSINNKSNTFAQSKRTILIDTLAPIPGNNKIELCVSDIFGNKATKTFNLQLNKNPKEDLKKVKKDLLFVIIEGSIENEPDQPSLISLLKKMLKETSNAELIVLQNTEKKSLERNLLFNIAEIFRKGEYQDLVLWFNGSGIEEKESSYWFPSNYNLKEKQTWFNLSFLYSITETIQPVGTSVFITNSVFLPKRLIGNRIFKDKPQALFFKHEANEQDTLSVITYFGEKRDETGKVDLIQMINDLSKQDPNKFKMGWLNGFHQYNNLPVILFW